MMMIMMMMMMMMMMFRAINKSAWSLILKVLFDVNQAFAPLLDCSLWGKHGGHTCGFSPRVLTFTWWECYGLCPWHKPTELAHSLNSVLVSISVFMALSTVFSSTNSPDNSPFSVFSLCSSSLISSLLVLSTFYLFMKVSFSPDIILCGRLGSKRQLTNVFFCAKN